MKQMLAIVMLFLLNALAHAGGLPAHLGTHYDLQPTWATGVRDPIHSVISVQGTDFSQGTGTFENNAVALDDYPADTRMVLQVGGLGSQYKAAGAVATFLDAVTADDGAGFREAVRARAAATAQLQASDRVVWQLGNEIQHPTLSGAIRAWAGNGEPGRSHDTWIVPLFAERYLAPAIAGIRQASAEAFFEPGRIHIALGSVVGAQSQPARDFIAALLAHRFTGAYAPELAGLTVADVVDTLTIHYTLVSPGWKTALDWLDGTGKRIWVTEEVGGGAASLGQGMGAATVATARFMDWLVDHPRDEDGARLFFWGAGIGPAGTRVEDGMPSLVDFVGDAALSRPDAQAEVVGTVETRDFALPGKRLILAYPVGQVAATLDSITLPGVDIASATLVTYTQAGMATSAPAVTGDTLHVGATLQPGQALALLVVSKGY